MTGHVDALSSLSPFGERLRALANADGAFCLLALDHRDAMRNAFARIGIEDVSPEMMLEVKGRIADALGVQASGVLLDPAAVEWCRPRDGGVLMPLEAQGYAPFAGGRVSRLEFSAADVAALGGDGCKLLVYYRADHPPTAWQQWELIERAAADAHAHGLPLVLEPLVYRLEGETDYPFGELVVAAARDLASSGADLLKLAFPGSAEASRELTAAADWVLLGGGETDRDSFAAQLEIAMSAGARGFIAGRPIWGGALGLDETEQRKWLAEEAVPYFGRLVGITHGRRLR
ncbi:beta/alpha barrel domain-containing protein [Amycolatopsis alkalitolerans]|uniref:DUF2090 domain-containing protein n=1 Tax=Amycolatopsis alkalitolerans TaxID=2547244 RepID=A0A5C4LWB7_9PSEU|nr:hypothetical protein [Amycolatopsis alkalitolerans]TNC22241.1 hypothetical protein FG385_26060 [Amycolatopsis alkalitolerans]